MSHKTGRLMCCVPFCKRSLKYDGEPGDEWICANHLKLVDARMRKLWNARKKRALDEDAKEGPVHELVYHRATRVWDKLKAQAIERAMGL